MTLEMKKSNQLVIGLFTQRTDAYRALEELREAGFAPSEIGAAFRSLQEESWFPSRVSEDETQDLVRDHQGAYEGPGVTGVGSGAAGSASGTNAVTPAGLSTGGGTTTAGPGRPGPIPGSDIPRRRHSSFETTGSANTANDRLDTPIGTERPRSGLQPEEHRAWWQRVKDIFVSKDVKMSRAEGIPEDAIDYGTGAGHLPLQTTVPAGSASASGWGEHAYSYEVGSFRDLLTELGLEAEAARYFSSVLPPGGALVTVRAAPRSAEAELILEGNKGQVRYEIGQPENLDLGEQYDDDRIAVFGDVQRACHIRDRGQPTSAENLEGFPGRVRNLRRPA